MKIAVTTAGRPSTTFRVTTAAVIVLREVEGLELRRDGLGPSGVSKSTIMSQFVPATSEAAASVGRLLCRADQRRQPVGRRGRQAMSLSHETLLELMSLADGELEGSDKERVERLVASDDEARQIVASLRGAEVGTWLAETMDQRAAASGADGIADAVMVAIAVGSSSRASAAPNGGGAGYVTRRDPRRGTCAQIVAVPGDCGRGHRGARPRGRRGHLHAGRNGPSRPARSGRQRGRTAGRRRSAVVDGHDAAGHGRRGRGQRDRRAAAGNLGIPEDPRQGCGDGEDHRGVERRRMGR